MAKQAKPKEAPVTTMSRWPVFLTSVVLPVVFLTAAVFGTFASCWYEPWQLVWDDTENYSEDMLKRLYWREENLKFWLEANVLRVYEPVSLALKASAATFMDKFLQNPASATATAAATTATADATAPVGHATPSSNTSRGAGRHRLLPRALGKRSQTSALLEAVCPPPSIGW